MFIERRSRKKFPIGNYSRELVELIFEQPYCRIQDVSEATGIAVRQTASLHLKHLVAIGVLEEMAFGCEKLFIHPKLMRLLTKETNDFLPYRESTSADS